MVYQDDLGRESFPLNEFVAAVRGDITAWCIAAIVSSALLLLVYSALPDVRRTPGWQFLFSSICEIYVAVGFLVLSLDEAQVDPESGLPDVERMLCADYRSLVVSVLAFDSAANTWRLLMYVDPPLHPLSTHVYARHSTLLYARHSTHLCARLCTRLCARACRYVDLIVVYHNPFRPNTARPLYHVLVSLTALAWATAISQKDVLQHAQSAPPWQRPSSAPAPPQGAPGGSGQLGTPRVRPSHWAPSDCLGCSSEPPPKPPISPSAGALPRRVGQHQPVDAHVGPGHGLAVPEP